MFPGFDNIKYFYDKKCYTNAQVKRFVELECITKEQYTEITNEPYPESVDTPTNVNVHAHSYQATIEAE